MKKFQLGDMVRFKQATEMTKGKNVKEVVHGDWCIKEVAFTEGVGYFRSFHLEFQNRECVIIDFSEKRTSLGLYCPKLDKCVTISSHAVEFLTIEEKEKKPLVAEEELKKEILSLEKEICLLEDVCQDYKNGKLKQDVCVSLKVLLEKKRLKEEMKEVLEAELIDLKIQTKGE